MSTDNITVYDGTSRERIALSAWKQMFRELWDSRELIHRLVGRNFAGQFRQSFLGYIWMVLPPIATTLIFTLLKQANVMTIPMPEGSMPYTLFVLVGTTIWGLFTQTTMMATNSIASAGSLVSKIYFPREVLVLSSVGNAVINVLARLIVVAITFVLLGYAPHWQVIFLPVYLIPLLAFAVGLGMVFATLNTMMHDVGRMLDFFFQFGLFLAPTVYPTPSNASIMGHWQHLIYVVHTINPVSHFMYAAQQLIETGSMAPSVGFQISSVISFLVLAMGWRFFHVCEPLLAERL